MLKFSEMPYARPDTEQVLADVKALTERMENAADYKEAKQVFLDADTLSRHVDTLSSLAYIRHSIDTTDTFYDEEKAFWNRTQPMLQEAWQAYDRVLLASPYREGLQAEYGDVFFINKEMELKTFSPEIIPEMQQENDLVTAYMKLIASAQIPFEGEIYTISQLMPLKTDADDARRLAAWKAEGAWYKAHQDELDSLYDRLVHLRDAMGKKLGYENYLQLGYYRMTRNCYDRTDVERFRAAVRDYLVPVAAQIYQAQAKRLGKTYPMSFADNALMFRSGNPRPKGTPEELLAAGKKFYDELSPETSAFFRMMLDCELMDVLSKKGKEGGGYCAGLQDYHVPFIFANFNGTQHDVEVITHEAGHAFADWLNGDRVPAANIWPGMEACEVHSMSMEILAEPWAEDFFGEDADKYRYSHLATELTFIPYGTMVDHFQHLVYEKPEMTPKQRHETWKELLGIYMPWMKLDGEIPFYSEGEGWQRQQHIYSVPLYYIDYCLAQTVALQFWAMMQEDRDPAWERYMAYTKQGGTQTFTQLLANAGLESPFDPGCLKKVCEKAAAWLEQADQSRFV